MTHKKPMRIAHIIGKLFAGGVESVVFNYYKNIDHSKFQFDFYYDSDSVVSPPEELVRMGVNFYKIPPYQKLPQYLKALDMHFKNKKYQIVHSHMNTLSVFPLYVAKRSGIPIRIAHNHSVPGKGETKKNIFKYTLKPFSKTFATNYCACSKHAGKWLFGKKTFNDGKVMVINNAIDLDKYKYNEKIRNEVRRELSLGEKFVVGHVGRFCYQKNHEFLIDVFSKIHDKDDNTVLLLVGTGELEESIKAKVKDLGLDNCVKFLGTRSDVEKIIQAIDVFVLPSRYEGLPVVGVEAQASGLNIITSTDVSKETAITKNIQFIELSDGAEKWADVILNCKNLQRLDECKNVAKAGFDIKVEAKKLEQYYEKLWKNFTKQ